MARGRRPWANTADRGPITGPIRNFSIHDNLIFFLSLLSIKTCSPPLYRLEKKKKKKTGHDVIVNRPSRIGRVPSVLAELRLYWPSCSVSADNVTYMSRTANAMCILYY